MFPSELVDGSEALAILPVCTHLRKSYPAVQSWGVAVVSLRNPSVDWLQVVSIAVCLFALLAVGITLYVSVE